MLIPQVKVVKKDLGLIELFKAMKQLERTDVLVGIPSERASRSGAEPFYLMGQRKKLLARHEPVNNAQLLFIHTKGSPLRNIPARPVIEPAITDPDNRKMITDQLAEAGAAALEGDPLAARKHLELAGQVATSLVKDWFTNPKNHWAPNAPSTIARKHSDRPLIDIGALRRAITYVVREKAA